MKNRNHGLSEKEMEIVQLLMADCETTGDIQAKLKKLFAGTIEQMLEAEMDEHLGCEKNSALGNNSGNIRNGYGKKFTPLFSLTESFSIHEKTTRSSANEYTPCLVSIWRDRRKFWGHGSLKMNPQASMQVYAQTSETEMLRIFSLPASISKAIFPTDDSLRKIIFMSVKEISKKWTMPVRDWGLAYSQLAIFFDDRFAD